MSAAIFFLRHNVYQFSFSFSFCLAAENPNRNCRSEITRRNLLIKNQLQKLHMSIACHIRWNPSTYSRRSVPFSPSNFNKQMTWFVFVIRLSAPNGTRRHTRLVRFSGMWMWPKNVCFDLKNKHIEQINFAWLKLLPSELTSLPSNTIDRRKKKQHQQQIVRASIRAFCSNGSPELQWRTNVFSILFLSSIKTI